MMRFFRKMVALGIDVEIATNDSWADEEKPVTEWITEKLELGRKDASESETVHKDAVKGGSERSETAQEKAAQNEPAQGGAERSDAAQKKAAQNEPAQGGAEQGETAQKEPAQGEDVQKGGR